MFAVQGAVVANFRATLVAHDEFHQVHPAYWVSSVHGSEVEGNLSTSVREERLLFLVGLQFALGMTRL